MQNGILQWLKKEVNEKKEEILVILKTPEVPRSSPKFPHKSKSKFLFLGEDGCIAENKSEMLAFPPKN